MACWLSCLYLFLFVLNCPSIIYRQCAPTKANFAWKLQLFFFVCASLITDNASSVHNERIASQDMTTTILGHKTSMPMMLSAVAMCKLGHPEGETAWNKGASREGIIYMVPTLSGCSFQQIVDARETADHPMFYQLYVNQDRAKTKKLVQTAESKGCSALFITCDAPQLGNRERDRRTKVTHSGAAAQGGKSGGSGQGTSKALTTFIDPSLNWDDLKWFKSITDMKIVLKGVATAEDAVMALEHGVAGVMLSNHGGRQLDFARSAIEVLPEVMEALKAHKKYNPDTFEVFIDGGVRRGSDIYKALALGAKAVGVGRPALYAMTAYGADGVQKMIQIMKSELEMTMRLMGAPSIADISPKGVITTDLARHVAMVPPDMLQRETYIPPVTQAFMNKFDRAGTKPAGAEAAAVPAGSGGASDGVVLVLESAKSILKTIFTTDVKTLLHRTALFMILFLVVHLKGNLFFFLGPEYMNGWGTFLTTGPVGKVIMAVEYYLLAAGVAHALAGAYQTWRYKKLALPKKDIASYPFGQAKLQLTGTVLAGYIYLHLTHFKFADIPNDKDGNRDLYGQVVKVLADPAMLAVYVGATALLGAHLWSGWAKTVLKFEIKDAEQRKRVASLGQTLIAIITVGFIAVSLAAHLTEVPK